MLPIIIIILIFIVGGFLLSVNKDNQELRFQPIQEKFAIIIHMLNDAAFEGKGEINILSNKELNIYDGSNQIIRLHYSTGHLSITWKYKYYQKEMIYERQFSNVRNLSIFEQQNIAQIAINDMQHKVEQHKMNVLGF